MGAKLATIAPAINAQPSVNKSIFKIHRDTRFSNDKTPFKTHLGIWFWEGSGKRMECSGFYFHVEPPMMMLGVGIYMLARHQMAEYRESVVDDKHAKEFSKIIHSVSRMKNCEIGRTHYKRIPSGFDPNHPNAEYLKFNGFYGGVSQPIPTEFHGPELVRFCFGIYKKLGPLHKWLLGVTERASHRQP